MCNVAAALGVGLLLLMGGRRGKKEDEYKPPVAPMPQTKYASEADDLASTNENLPNDGTGSPTTSTSIKTGKNQSAGQIGYRNPLAIPPPAQSPSQGLPTIGSYSKQKPVNY
jgi:hypothetical protein